MSAKPRAEHDPLQAVLDDRRLERRALRALAQELALQPVDPCGRERHRGDRQRHLLLGDQTCGEQHDGIGRAWRGRLGAADVQSPEHRQRAAQVLLAQALRVQLGEAEGALANGAHSALDELSTRPPAAPR